MPICKGCNKEKDQIGKDGLCWACWEEAVKSNYNFFREVNNGKALMKPFVKCKACGLKIENSEKLEQYNLGRATPTGLSCIYELKCPACKGKLFELGFQMW